MVDSVLIVLRHFMFAGTERYAVNLTKALDAMGVNVPLLYTLVFAFGMALAAFAGMIAAPISSVFPGMGHQILIIFYDHCYCW